MMPIEVDIARFRPGVDIANLFNASTISGLNTTGQPLLVVGAFITSPGETYAKESRLTAWLLLSASGSLFAQATATINGRIVDQAGAVLPGTTITVRDTRTGTTRDTVTNAEGLYSVPALTPGTYTVKAELPGFAPQVRSNIEVLIGATLTLDLQMGIAQLQESLTVTAASPMVETTQSVLSSSIRSAEVLQLPMLNRNLAAMMTLLPGAREVPITGPSAHGTSANYVSFGGGTGRNFNMLVDGIDNKEDNDGGTVLTYSLEGVQEFKVLQTGSAAEYGTATTTVLLATKSGTNQVRGSGLGYYRNENLVATDYFSKPANGGQGKQPFERQQYGGSIGGPLKKDRAWFFGSIERVKQEYSTPKSPAAFDQLAILLKVFPDINAVNSRGISQPSRALMSQAKVNARLGPKPHWVVPIFVGIQLRRQRLSRDDRRRLVVPGFACVTIAAPKCRPADH